jgi:hypothetical protein
MKNVKPAEKSIFKSIFSQLAKLMEWLAKAQEANPPCVG